MHLSNLTSGSSSYHGFPSIMDFKFMKMCWHFFLVTTAKFLPTTGPLHSHSFCLKQFPRAFFILLSPHPSDGPFWSLHIFLSYPVICYLRILFITLIHVFPKMCYLFFLFFPLDCQVPEARPFLFPSPLCPFSVWVSISLLTDWLNDCNGRRGDRK